MVFLSLFGLGGLFVFGHVAGNAQSWFKVGTSSLQPSEFVKLCVIIYLSAVYAKKQAYINEFNKGVVPPLVYLVLVYWVSCNTTRCWYCDNHSINWKYDYFFLRYEFSKYF